MFQSRNLAHQLGNIALQLLDGRTGLAVPPVCIFSFLASLI